MTETREDVLTRVTRDRARAYARLTDAEAEILELKTELHNTRVELEAALGLLAYAYHGLELAP